MIGFNEKTLATTVAPWAQRALGIRDKVVGSCMFRLESRAAELGR
jgi:hypothetical protein